MLSIALMLVSAPAYADLSPFSDEEAAAHAFEAHISCLGEGAMKHKDDAHDARIIAAEIVQACGDKAAVLRSALRDVYRRKPALTDGKDAAEAANEYVSGATARVEEAIQESRVQKK